jgi:hypothetical protein
MSPNLRGKSTKTDNRIQAPMLGKFKGTLKGYQEYLSAYELYVQAVQVKKGAFKARVALQSKSPASLARSWLTRPIFELTPGDRRPTAIQRAEYDARWLPAQMAFEQGAANEKPAPASENQNAETRRAQAKRGKARRRRQRRAINKATLQKAVIDSVVKVEAAETRRLRGRRALFGLRSEMTEEQVSTPWTLVVRGKKTKNDGGSNPPGLARGGTARSGAFDLRPPATNFPSSRR